MLASVGQEKICGMIASCDHFRREPYLWKRGRVRTWTSSTSHADAFAHAGDNSKKLGRRLACRRLAAIRSHGRIVRPECGRRPIQKARDRFPGAGFDISCDDEIMPVICPTCQILKVSVTIRHRRQSNPCTGGVFFAAVPSGILPG
jgi:hypothetical protein